MIVLDTTVLIDLLRGDERARTYLRGLDDVPACSEISRIELLRGIRPSERDGAERLMAALTWIGLDEQIARHAGGLGRRWRRTHRLATPDLVIAATAEALGTTVATSNVRHFPMFDGLRPPYE
jgi:predicted nucleic acid-binding protein